MRSSETEPSAPPSTDRFVLLTWLAVAVAFSRVLLDLAGSLRETDAFWPILLPIPLMLLCSARGTPASAGARPGGAPLLLLGMVLNVLGILVDAWSIARIGLPLAVIGAALLTGRPALPVAMMSLWLVPVPNSILALATPHPESAFALLASAVTTALGAPTEASGPVVAGPSGTLQLSAYHGGLPLAVAGALLGWYAALRCGGRLVTALCAAVVGALAAIPVHALGLCLAAFVLWSGHPDAGQAIADWGMLVVGATAVVGRIELRTAR